MNYYSLRQRVAISVKDWLAAQSKGESHSTYKDFVRRMTLDFGATEKMILQNLEMYNLTVVDDKLVKIK